MAFGLNLTLCLVARFLSTVEKANFSTELRAAEVALSSATSAVLTGGAIPAVLVPITLVPAVTTLPGAAPGAVVPAAAVPTAATTLTAAATPTAVPGAVPRVSLTGPLPPIAGRPVAALPPVAEDGDALAVKKPL